MSYSNVKNLCLGHSNPRSFQFCTNSSFLPLWNTYFCNFGPIWYKCRSSVWDAMCHHKEDDIFSTYNLHCCFWVRRAFVPRWISSTTASWATRTFPTLRFLTPIITFSLFGTLSSTFLAWYTVLHFCHLKCWYCCIKRDLWLLCWSLFTNLAVRWAVVPAVVLVVGVAEVVLIFIFSASPIAFVSQYCFSFWRAVSPKFGNFASLTPVMTFSSLFTCIQAPTSFPLKKWRVRIHCLRFSIDQRWPFWTL